MLHCLPLVSMVGQHGAWSVETDASLGSFSRLTRRCRDKGHTWFGQQADADQTCRLCAIGDQFSERRSCFIAGNRDDRNAPPQCLSWANANAGVGGASDLHDRSYQLAVLGAMVVLDDPLEFTENMASQGRPLW